MKKKFFIIFFVVHFCGFSQEKLSKKFTSISKFIEVSLFDIDQVTIENSLTPNVFEIELTEQDSKFYDIEINQGKIIKLNVKLQSPKIFVNQRNTFCVEFPNYVNCVIRMPRGINFILFSKNIDVISKKFDGNSSIYINKGNIKITNPKGDTMIKLFSGMVNANLFHSAINIQTSKGQIIFDDEQKKSPFVTKIKNTNKKFNVHSINSNVIINSKFKDF